MKEKPQADARRELKTRNQAWAQALARRVAGWGLSPNAISVASVGFAALAVGALLAAAQRDGGPAALYYIVAAASIQLRLVCNLLDGMVAIEWGKKSATGGIYNEAPDRLADVILLVAAGEVARQGAPGVLVGTALPLGWLAAVLAMGTAYVRALGGTLTGQQNFMGPMAKQHRMFWLTLACLAAAASPLIRGSSAGLCFRILLHGVVAGAACTCWRRLREIARVLRDNKPVES